LQVLLEQHFYLHNFVTDRRKWLMT